MPGREREIQLTDDHENISSVKFTRALDFHQASSKLHQNSSAASNHNFEIALLKVYAIITLSDIYKLYIMVVYTYTVKLRRLAHRCNALGIN